MDLITFSVQHSSSSFKCLSSLWCKACSIRFDQTWSFPLLALRERARGLVFSAWCSDDTICLWADLLSDTDEPSLIRASSFTWKASVSDSLKPTNARQLQIKLQAYWEYHGLAGCQSNSYQTAWEVCRSFSCNLNSFGDTFPREAAFALGSSAVEARQLVEIFPSESQKAAEQHG